MLTLQYTADANDQDDTEYHPGDSESRQSNRTEEESRKPDNSRKVLLLKRDPNLSCLPDTTVYLYEIMGLEGCGTGTVKLKTTNKRIFKSNMITILDTLGISVRENPGIEKMAIVKIKYYDQMAGQYMRKKQAVASSRLLKENLFDRHSYRQLKQDFVKAVSTYLEEFDVTVVETESFGCRFEITFQGYISKEHVKLIFKKIELTPWVILDIMALFGLTNVKWSSVCQLLAIRDIADKYSHEYCRTLRDNHKMKDYDLEVMQFGVALMTATSGINNGVINDMIKKARKDEKEPNGCSRYDLRTVSVPDWQDIMFKVCSLRVIRARNKFDAELDPNDNNQPKVSIDRRF